MKKVPLEISDMADEITFKRKIAISIVVMVVISIISCFVVTFCVNHDHEGTKLSSDDVKNTTLNRTAENRRFT